MHADTCGALFLIFMCYFNDYSAASVLLACFHDILLGRHGVMLSVDTRGLLGMEADRVCEVLMRLLM